MPNALILHGTQGSPDINWFRWLEAELKAKGYDVTVPVLPTPENQNVQAWYEAVANFDFNEDTVIFGHSCGATFALYLLEQLQVPVAKAVLVAPVIDIIDIFEYDALNKTFIEYDYDWDKVKAGAKEVCLLCGDDDPYVPEDQPQFIAERLGITPEVIAGGGHLNAETGYTEFPRLLKLI